MELAPVNDEYRWQFFIWYFVYGIEGFLELFAGDEPEPHALKFTLCATHISDSIQCLTIKVFSETS